MRLHTLTATIAAASLFLPMQAQAEFPRGKPAPAFKLRRLDGPPLALAELRGKVVLLDFWGPG